MRSDFIAKERMLISRRYIFRVVSSLSVEGINRGLYTQGHGFRDAGIVWGIGPGDSHL